MKLRLEREQPLTFLEFNYMILQSYDFRELHRRHGVTLQMGGSDQWGNIVSGVELARRTDGDAGVRPDHAADHHRVRRQDGQDGAGRGVADRATGCRPTITGSSGATPRTPMSAASCACSPTCRWTRSPGWRRSAGAEINEAKKVLATEATALAHGRAAAEEAAETARRAFEEGEAAETLPTHDVARGGARRGHPAVPPVRRGRPRASNGEARRLIRGGGARVNDVAITDEAHVVSAADLRDGAIKLSAGRKQHRLVRPE